MAAITKGIADRVKKYLDKALSINSNNIIANLSKGIWHAEIINQAGKTIANTVYGAKVSHAINYFIAVENHNNFKQIGVLYELAYGYSLLGEALYLEKAKVLINSLLKKDAFSEMDKIYKKKAILLLELLP